MKYAQYQKSIGNSKVKPLYVLTGGEIFLRQEAIRLLKKRLGEDKFFFKEYEGDNLNLAELVSEIYSRPLFEEWNLVIVKKAGPVAAALHDPLTKYLNSPVPSSVVVIELEKLDQRTRFAKLVESKGVLVECDSLKEKTSGAVSELAGWIMNRVSRYQKKISLEVADYLGKMVGPGLNDLDLQLQKLSMFAAGKDTIELQDIRNLVENRHRINIFDLMDAIFSRQTGPALQLLSQLFKTGNIGQDGQLVIHPSHIALQCLRLIHFRLRQLWKYSVSHDEDLPQFLQWKLAKQAPLFSEQALASIWKKLMDTEWALKTSQLAPFLALEQLILFITGVGAHASRHR